MANEHEYNRFDTSGFDMSSFISDRLLYEAGLAPETADMIKYRFYQHIANKIAVDISTALDQLRVFEISGCASGGVIEFVHRATQDEDGECNDELEKRFLSEIIELLTSTRDGGHKMGPQAQ